MATFGLKESDGSVVNADRLTLSSDFRDGFIRSLRALTQDDARVAATNAYRKDGKTVYENGVVTSCKPCEEHPERPPLWRVKSTRIIHDKERAEQSITRTRSSSFTACRSLGFPISTRPTPRLSSKSGFLRARIMGSSSNTLGYFVTTPFYWAISPNYDLTLSPTFTTNAGYLMQADWRQRLWNGSYEIKLAGAYNDSAQDFLGDRNWRGSVRNQRRFRTEQGIGISAGTPSSKATILSAGFTGSTTFTRPSACRPVYLTGMGETNYFNIAFARYGNLTGDTYVYETGTYQKSSPRRLIRASTTTTSTTSPFLAANSAST